MTGLSSPFVRTELSAAFSRPAILRVYTYYLLAMSAIVFFWWPRGSLAASFREGAAPATFAAAALGLFGCLAYLNARLGAQDFPGKDVLALRDALTLTPVSVASIVFGKLAAGIAHTIFLLALGTPFLLAARGVSGAPPGAAASALVVAGCSALAFRLFGFLLFALFERRPVLKDVLLFFGGLALALLPMLAAPAANAVSTLLGLGSDGRGAGPGLAPVWVCAIYGLAVTAVFSVGSFAALMAIRRKRL